jgi:hypothetical protein
LKKKNQRLKEIGADVLVRLCFCPQYSDQQSCLALPLPYFQGKRDTNEHLRPLAFVPVVDFRKIGYEE